jgi:hypothetical protein
MRILAILLVLLCIGCGKQPTIAPDIREAYNATCKVENPRGVGTGVLLESGYVITAAHVVDWLMKDGNIDMFEAITNSVTFNIDGVSSVHTALVVAMGDWQEREDLDIAILRIENPPKSSIRLTTHGDYKKYLYGEKIYTIGHTNGDELRVTDGRLDNHYKPNESLDRATCDVYRGNSGGGVFAEDGRLLGIVVRLKTTPIHNMVDVDIPIPSEIHPGLPPRMVSGSVYYTDDHIIPQWCEFVNAERVEFIANINGLHEVVHRPMKINYLTCYAAVFINLLALVIIYKNVKPFLRVLLGKRMR